MHFDLTSTSEDQQRNGGEVARARRPAHRHWSGPEEGHVCIADPKANELRHRAGQQFLAAGIRSEALCVRRLARRSVYVGSEALDGRWSGIRTREPIRSPRGGRRSLGLVRPD